MITVKATITCTYQLTEKEEYEVLKYADEHSLELEKAIEQLQKDDIIDILFDEPCEETVKEINEATFEEDERDYDN